MTIKIKNIFAVAHATWHKFRAIDLPPTLSYDLEPFCKEVSDQIETLLGIREKMRRSAAGVAEGQNPELKEGTPEANTFVEEMTAFIETDSTVVPDSHRLQEILAAIKPTKHGLSVDDITLLKPFFAE